MIYQVKKYQEQKIKTPFTRVVIKNQPKQHKDITYFEKTFETVSEK